MKSYRFGSKQLNIKLDLLTKMIDAAVSARNFSQADIKKEANVSHSDAEEFVFAMDECRFTYLANNRSNRTKEQHDLHTFSDTLSILVIDISMPQYSMSIIRGHSGCQFHKTYSYNPYLSFYENLSSFFAREGEKVIDQPFGIAAICVIYADKRECNLSGFSKTSVHLPGQSDLDKIDSIIATTFGALPILHLKNSQAIKKAIQYRVSKGSLDNSSTTYIYIGVSISAVHFPRYGDPIICDANNILVNDRETVSDIIDKAISSEGLGNILYRIINFTHCAYSAERYIIEYDSLKFDARSLKELKRAFVLIGEALPEITTSSHIPGLAHFGAAVASEAECIGKYITSTQI